MTQEQKLEVFKALGQVCSDLKEKDNIFAKCLETEKSVELQVDNLSGIISHWNKEHGVQIQKYFGSEGVCARRGILVKSSEILENSHKVDTVIFDKTGTLTYGNLKVSKIFNFRDYEVCMQYLGRFYVSDFSGRLDIICIESNKRGYPKHEDVLVPKNEDNTWNLRFPVPYLVSALIKRKAREWNKIHLHHAYKANDNTIQYDTYGFDVSVYSSELVPGNEIWLKELMKWANSLGVSVKNIYWFSCANGEEVRLKYLEDDTYTMVIL